MAYEVIFSDDVLKTLDAVIYYLEINWSKPVAERFYYTFFQKVEAVAQSPFIGKLSFRNSSIRKILITKHNALYYEVSENSIQLLQLFDTRQNPVKNKFE